MRTISATGILRRVERPALTLSATVLDAPDPRALAAFYQRLVGWPVVQDDPTWVTLRPPGGRSVTHVGSSSTTGQPNSCW